ncbi:MAG: uroporphyrinogen-III C-methyltransferase [Lacisediminimonas sp.]|nr:uroporphyrinogen-III C-methyltransferase [Lacisediminimonas sp.]
MDDTPLNPNTSSSPLPLPPEAAASGRAAPGSRLRQPWLRRALVLVPLLLLALIGLAWWSAQSELRDLRRDTAQRLQAGDSINSETKGIVRSAQESLKELQAKVNVLESKQLEAQSQQLALDQLYQELARNRDEWALAEIEQVLSTASQQLQLAGNVRGALIALQNADTRLSRADKPQFITIRRALARDMEKLKALPAVDMTGLALRLDSVIAQIDSMPLLSDEKPALPASKPRNARRADDKSARPGWLGTVEEAWNSWSSEMWNEVRQLIRVRNVETSDALLLSPTQAYYARENLKLRLLNARLALLTRNESAFRSDLIAAQDVIARYFDGGARQTQTTQALLKQVQASNLSIEMPTLNESLGAVRNFKVKP